MLMARVLISCIVAVFSCGAVAAQAVEGLGWPTYRVLKWSAFGSINDLGERCDKFYGKLDADITGIEQENNIVGNFSYKNLTYRPLYDRHSGEAHGVACQVEIHSARKDVFIFEKYTSSKYWVQLDMDSDLRNFCLENDDQFGSRQCQEAMTDKCRNDFAEVRMQPLAAYPQFNLNASLLQGHTCNVRYIQVQIGKN